MIQLKKITNFKFGKKSFRQFWAIACLIFLLSLSQLTPTLAATDNSLFGVYYGNNGFQMAQVQALETWQGKKNTVINLFTTWCDKSTVMDTLFNDQLLNIWNNQNVPMITWEPFSCPVSSNPTDAELRSITPGDIEIRAAYGEYDAYFHNWADRMKVFLSGPDGIYNTNDDRRAYIRFAHEMNGNWYPWSPVPGEGGNPASDYILMWQRVKSLFFNKGMEWTHLQWVWCVNYNDYLGYNAEALYPGDAYVDWISISGYNWGASQTWSPWITPEQTFSGMLGRLKALSTRPISITEVASTPATPSGISTDAKAQWISNFYKYILANDIKMVVWFNFSKETDWSVFGGPSGDSYFDYYYNRYNAYSSYKNAISADAFVPSDPNNPRLLTDAKFAGY
ncbi:glycoside hydrolase family 26 protein [Chroococcidiopsis sp.]|uniref:glycoside hydrolase family 26 protein n=1 Tax=Chroococcidiopsis sp. TaxID=3088168 RepID=UPI003F34480D